MLELFSPMGNPNNVSTAVVQTVSVRQTQAALDTLVAQITQAAAATATPLPSNTPHRDRYPHPDCVTHPDGLAYQHAGPADRHTGAADRYAGATQAPFPSPLPSSNSRIACYQIGQVKDISIADGTDLTAGQSFTKTWRLYNAGTVHLERQF